VVELGCTVAVNAIIIVSSIFLDSDQRKYSPTDHSSRLASRRNRGVGMSWVQRFRLKLGDRRSITTSCHMPRDLWDKRGSGSDQRSGGTVFLNPSSRASGSGSSPSSKDNSSSIKASSNGPHG
jgi:hypothetical protein